MHRRWRRWACRGAALVAVVSAGEARAAGARTTAPTPPVPIFGGAEAEICAFPGVVALDGVDTRCTGTLVHPRVVLYAAHCGDAIGQVRFGQSADDRDHAVEPDLCRTNPDYAGLGDEGADWAFCRLSEPAPVPVVPIAFGCETALVEPGAEAVIVGYGESESGAGDGPKRWAAAPVRLVLADYFEVGGLGEPGVCAGDSGGPALIQTADGTWRVFGVASVHAAGCGGIGHYAYAWDAIPWIEAEADVDLTPCHDDDGSWRPDFRCSGFAPADSVGAGAWDDLCAAAPVGPAGTSCGAAFDAEPDTTPPTVAITSPSPGAYPGPEVKLEIEVEAEDVGWGVAEVALEIDGESPGHDDEPPWKFGTAVFPSGSYTLVAVAEDAAGHVTRSEPVVIEVGAEPDTDTDTGEPEAGSAGCACATGRGGGGLAWMFFGTWCLGHVRRGRRSRP
ncbi:trypsin-like serine protease [Nannocystis pusilla]|uniref:Trypsin-like serine protease n=1 Tax=Nannocystis pusilla TaxID=889268 RepID=A0ABS7TJX8_9BACT|nr:trypsin-like serine protease [Nannocystis pusilla]MBZ5708530.1 trypsin-like serine protease [Nannocystis pusilla]